jgi:CCR4-NOT transcription complex subunit 1
MQIYSFEGADLKLSPVEGLAGGRSPVGTPNQAWLCRDLLVVLSQLTDAGHFPAVRLILEMPAKTCPEVSRALGLIGGMACMHA